MNDFVLEVGVENIPASYVPPAIAQLAADAAALLARGRIAYGELYTTGTPRRLALVARAVADRQAEGEEVATGPPASKAFLEDGRPAPAAEGFARAQGVEVSALERVTTPRGEYLAVRRRLDRRKTTAVLAEEMPALIANLKFPKTMKWEAGAARFARPVRWIVALYGADVVPFSFAGVESGRVTCARPWMRGERLSIPDARAYFGRVKSLGVVLDHDQRRKRIGELARRAAAASRLHVIEDDELLTELAFMLEDPRVLVGAFDRRYLDLPPQVIVTAMRAHQRYVALADSRGALVPRFVTFTDGPVKGVAEVVRGNERVLRARLEDAEFYWREDSKRGVEALSDELDRIVFIEGLGSVGQKWRRVLEVAREVNARLSAATQVDDRLLARSARLAKADLASTMIRDGKEFTALQGIIGAHYAEAAGEDATVAGAIRDHYAPRAAGDPLPASTLARVLGIADRIDTIVGSFLSGQKPTGSQDPFAIRRSANGVVRLAAELAGLRLDEVLEFSGRSYGSVLDRDQLRARWQDQRVGAEIAEFLRSRVEAFLRDNAVPFDVAAAVMPAGWAEPALALSRARAIATLRGDHRFERLVTGVRRVGNILAKERRKLGGSLEDIRSGLAGTGGVGSFSDGLFQDPVEADLLAMTRATLDGIGESEARGNAGAILRALSSLADPIDAYFERVLVNCEDPALRANRHALLAAVYALFGRYADFLAIVEQGSTPAP